MEINLNIFHNYFSENNLLVGFGFTEVELESESG